MKSIDADSFASVVLPQQHQERVELLQFTDTHIYPGAGQCFDEVDTGKTLQQVIDHARRRHWPPDAVLVTGDLVHDPVAASYERLYAMLESLQRPVFCIPGNHDEPSLMHRVLTADNVSTAKSILFDRWLIMMLDSFLPGTHAGRLRDSELGHLDRTLTQHRDRYALICLHHPPVAIGSPWMDRMGLQNPADLFEIVDHHPQVRGILWGHIHQQFCCERKGVKLMATPSTCVQFTPGAEGYCKDDKPPAYRYIHLHSTGAIDSGVVTIMDKGTVHGVHL